jgi:hypothetical protein
MLGVRAEFERNMIQSRVNAGLGPGQRRMVEGDVDALASGMGKRKAAHQAGRYQHSGSRGRQRNTDDVV